MSSKTMMVTDYSKLSPPLPTPKEEKCNCGHRKSVKLMYALNPNPITCVDCNLEIEPTLLNLSQEVVDEIVFWRHIYGSIYHLWLASGDYEKWAEKELANLGSPVNNLGLKARSSLNEFHPCFYWVFQDQSEETFSPISVCPICHEPLNEFLGTKFKQVRGRKELK